MSYHAYHSRDSARHTHVPGVGSVPTGPRTYNIQDTMSQQQIEGRPNTSHTPQLPSTRIPYYHDGTWHFYRPSRSAPAFPDERAYPEPLSAVASRGQSSRALRCQQAWSYQPQNQQKKERWRLHDTEEYPLNRERHRSRSRSPIRDLNANRFSRRGNVLATGDEVLLSVPAPLSVEIPSYLEVEQQPPKECLCPISWNCRCRVRQAHDCKPLTPKHKEWIKVQADQVRAVERGLCSLNIDKRTIVAQLNRFSGYCARISDRPNGRKAATFDNVLEWINTVQACDFEITPEALEQSRVLRTLKDFSSEDKKDLRATARVPVAIEEDLEFLMRKWIRGDLGNHPDRGLIIKKKIRGGENLCLDKAWAYYKSANYFGAGDLVNGQRWLKRAHMMRDGVHGASIAGIWGHAIEKGAQALVMGRHGQGNGGYYADRDQGNEVWYIGTARPKKGVRRRVINLDSEDETDDEDGDDDDNAATVHTRMLLTSEVTKKPVRLIRSDKLPFINKYRPSQGYRFDGLYEVVDNELLDKGRKIYRFHLRRLPGQGPIRVNDMRTFDDTPEEIARKRRAKESARRYREMMSASINGN